MSRSLSLFGLLFFAVHLKILIVLLGLYYEYMTCLALGDLSIHI